MYNFTTNPKIAFKKTDNGCSAYLILPEFEKENIQIELENDYINVIASKDDAVFTQSITRSIYISDPKQFNTDEIKADLKNGILKIDIPFNKEYKKKSLIKIH